MAPSRRTTDAAGVARGLVEVVQDHDDRQLVLAVEGLDQVKDLELVVEVEEGRRLVEQEDAGLLGERHRQPDTLAFAARER